MDRRRRRNDSEEVIDSYGYFVSRETLEWERSRESGKFIALIPVVLFSNEETLDAKILRRREQKWLDMFANWPRYFEGHFDQLKKRCRKGIPPAVRGQAWYHLSAAKYRQEAGNRQCPTGNLFQFYLTQSIQPRVLEDINKDLTRSFPDHEMFRGDACG